MTTAYVECWKCDECGFRWIKSETWPERCASSKCRSRRWNNGDNNTSASSGGHHALSGPVTAKRKRASSLGELGDGGSHGSDNPTQDRAVGGVPGADMRRLREIASGIDIEPTFSEVPSAHGWPPEPERQQCDIKWWEEGEQYQCLMDKCHKNPKHGQFGMVRNITP